MPITNGYANLAELKVRLGIRDAAEDAVLEAVIQAASRAIDNETGRTFYAATETRFFTAEDDDVLFIDDLLELTTLKTDEDGDRVYEQVWAATDFDLEPYNKVPFTRLRVAPRSTKAFPTGRRAVEITGSWGYSATAPDPVREACLIQSARLFKRKDAPFGVMGNAEVGVVRLPKLDPDVKVLLSPYVKLELGSV